MTLGQRKSIKEKGALQADWREVASARRCAEGLEG